MSVLIVTFVEDQQPLWRNWYLPPDGYLPARLRRTSCVTSITDEGFILGGIRQFDDVGARSFPRLRHGRRRRRFLQPVPRRAGEFLRGGRRQQRGIRKEAYTHIFVERAKASESGKPFYTRENLFTFKRVAR